MRTIDIDSRNSPPSCLLSNFAEHPFVFDGVHCKSMEGFLQALKFKETDEQRYVCSLGGKEAKTVGVSRNTIWQESQTLWWDDDFYPRVSMMYTVLITRAYDALFETDTFKEALGVTKGLPLTHKIGQTNPEVTVLTESEFIHQLLRLRRQL